MVDKNNRFVAMPLHALETVRGRIATAISAAFAFVIALSWNDAMKLFVENLITNLGIEKTTTYYYFMVAILVTILGVFGIYIASKLAVQPKEPSKVSKVMSTWGPQAPKSKAK